MRIKEVFAASEVRIAVHTHFRVSMICTIRVLLYLTWTAVLSRKQGYPQKWGDTKWSRVSC